MRYFLDAAYIEGNFRNPYQLISLGLVGEDGRTYYAQSADVNRRFASGFVRQHILPRLDPCPDNYDAAVHTWYVPSCAPACPWKQNTLISAEVLAFVTADATPPEFWGYTASHAWVVFCQLLGGIRELPDGWPVYCRDLKQWIDGLRDQSKAPTVSMSYHAMEAAQSSAALWKTLTALDVPHAAPGL